MTAGNGRWVGSPYALHMDADEGTMLDAVGIDSVEDLFDISGEVRFDGEFGVDSADEQELKNAMADLLSRNEELTEFLDRGHHVHYAPALVDDLSRHSEFLILYTQYQPEITQGFLQVLFEYQSMLVELTGLPVVNCSMYDAATVLAKTALLANRLRRGASDHRVLIPEHLHEGRLGVLESYLDSVEMEIGEYPMDDGTVDAEAFADLVSDEIVMVYVETSTVHGVIEERPADISSLAHDNDALFCIGSDPVALALPEEPVSVGADVVVDGAGTLGLGTAYGMGLDILAIREEYLRWVPGHLVGVSEGSADMRVSTLTLQTREQYIRKERATSNICTNQTWVTLRTAIYTVWLGPDRLVDLTTQAVTDACDLAARPDELLGVKAPPYDRHHFREFVVRTGQPAPAITNGLAGRGFVVHALNDHHLQVCITDANADVADGLVAAFEKVI